MLKLRPGFFERLFMLEFSPWLRGRLKEFS